MMDQAAHPARGEGPGVPAAQDLRAALASGDAVAEAAGPILRYLLAAPAASFFTEDILARVRGLMGDLSARLVAALTDDVAAPLAAPGEVELLARALADHSLVLGHAHACALEWRATERLHDGVGIDPVISPLVQERVGETGDRTFLQAQARWCREQRRMQWPLEALPPAVLEAVLAVVDTLIGDDLALRQRLAGIRAWPTEGSARRLDGLDVSDRNEWLELRRGGLALFLSALASQTGQPRDAVVLALHETQATRLALLLKAAGAGRVAIVEQVLVLHPDATLHEAIGELTPSIAAALLAQGRPA